MSGHVITESVQLEVIRCHSCGYAPFAIPTHMAQQRRKDGKNFFCPMGHTLAWGESENDKLRQERDRLKQQVAYKDDEIAHQKRYRESAERSARAMKGVATRLKNRAAAGLCPCCGRSFRQLSMHMKKKHPDFRGADVVQLVAEKVSA